MSTQVTNQNNFTTITVSSIEENSLIQEGDPILSFIPNLKELRCTQINTRFIDVRRAFFDTISKIGNTTNDIDKNQVIYLKDYIKQKTINTLVNQKRPEDRKAMEEAIKKGAIGLLTLRIAMKFHYDNHLGNNMDTCHEPSDIFNDLVSRSHLNRAKMIVEKQNFLNDLDCDISSLAMGLFETIKSHYTIVDQTTLQVVKLKNKRTKQHFEKHEEESRQISNIFKEFNALLNSEKALSILLQYSSATKEKQQDLLKVITKTLQKEKTKQADARSEQFLKELEEEEKLLQTKPSKNMPHSNRKSRASHSPQPSNVKKTLPEKSTQPKKIVEKSDIALLKELDHVMIKKLTLHPRIKRWSKVTPDTIKEIKDWDKQGNQWNYPYEKDPFPDYTIASHDLSFIVRLLRSKLAKTYAKSYSFVDTENKKRQGWALLVDMQWQGKEYKGTIFAGVGDDNVLYHAHFTKFSASSKEPMIDMLCEQLRELVKNNKDEPIKAEQENNSKEWETQGIFSVKRESEGKDVLLMMNNAKRDVTFVLYPVQGES